MKTLCKSTIMAMILGAVFLAGSARSGDTPEKPDMPKMTPEEQAAMVQWMELSQPSDHHKHLNFFVGKWKTKTTMHMGGPGSPAMESAGTSDIRWVLGGRFLMDEHHGSMMGQPYEGIGITGYDNFRNMYFTSWHSNMQTNVLTSTGARNPKTGNFTYYGEMDEPALGVVGRTVKYVTRIVDKDNYAFEIIDLHAGDEYEVIKIEYTRVK